MKGGAVMCEMSPRTVVRKERKSESAERWVSLAIMFAGGINPMPSMDGVGVVLEGQQQ
jgi:hypothetical protein